MLVAAFQTRPAASGGSLTIFPLPCCIREQDRLISRVCPLSDASQDCSTRGIRAGQVSAPVLAQFVRGVILGLRLFSSRHGGFQLLPTLLHS